MGDAHPSLAPQWLKSGTSFNLRPQTQSGASTGSGDDSSRAQSWREGSRLGLGAGADREAASDSKPQALLSGRREKPSFAERTSSRTYQPSPAERRPSYPRPSNPNPHRQLSDRELVEQMPLLKLRTGARLGGEAFSDDAYKAGSAQKDVDRGGRARPQSNLRKPAAGQRPVAAPLSRVEKELAGLPKQSAPRGGSSGILSPRQSAADQPWTSRLADVSLPTLQAVPDKFVSSPIPAVSSGANVVAADTTAKPPPRMADTILQAQTTAAQEQETARAAKARKEQLALRQSKQLIPVMPSSKVKHPGSNAAPDRPHLTSLRKSSGMEPLGKVSTPAHAVRKEEESFPNIKGAPSAGPSKPGLAVSTSGTPSPKALPGKPGRERDRLTFFSSLKRKVSGGDQAAIEENGGLHRQASSNASEATSAVENHDFKRDISIDPETSADRPFDPPLPPSEAASKGRCEDVFKMTPEELVFMRSLGWEENGDDVGGGLTEEEVAAFKARHPPSKSDKKAGTPIPQRLPQTDNFATTAENATLTQHMSCSFHSELDFSDSDSQ